MSKTKYPLCARAGLKVHFETVESERMGVPDSSVEYNVRAADVEKWLEGATVVRARLYDNGVFGEWYHKAQEDDTHTARLVMIEPIKPKSLGDKILEVLDDHSKSATESLTAIRRLLEGK